MGIPFINNRQILVSYAAVIILLCTMSILMLTLYAGTELGNALVDAVTYSELCDGLRYGFGDRLPKRRIP